MLCFMDIANALMTSLGQLNSFLFFSPNSALKLNAKLPKGN